MSPGDSPGEDGGIRKPARTYLRKGQGTARFGPMYGSGLRGAHRTFKPQIDESPAIRLPRFAPSSCLPVSARTVDSGISNEDETRPPTTASLPMDQPSTASPPMDQPSTSPVQDFQRHSNFTPTVIEEHEDDGKDINEYVEGISAMPTFIPEDGASSIGEPCSSDMSDNALRLRDIANQMRIDAQRINSMKSVSTTQSSYSTPTGPLVASTPINPANEPDDGSSFHLNPSLFAETNAFPSSSVMPLETPLARSRPFSKNRINQIGEYAQTGISLLNKQRTFPFQKQQQNVNSLLHNVNRNENSQKENSKQMNISEQELAYDQQVRELVRERQNLQKERVELQEQLRINHNLTIQLRDTIAHLDFADEEVHNCKRKLEEGIMKMEERKVQLDKQYAKLRKQLEDDNRIREKDLDEDFRKKVESIQEENRLEDERLKRERRDIERERKILQKGTGEKQKELTETINTLKEKLSTSETKSAKLRQDLRARDDKIKAKNEENEKLTKDNARLKTTCQTLEKRIKQLRSEKERDEKEREMFSRAEGNRKCGVPSLINNTSVGPSATSTASSRLPSVSSMTNSKKVSANRGRSISWADEPDEQSLEVIDYYLPQELIMKKCGEETDQCGKWHIFADAAGEVTKVMETVANGLTFKYSNGDCRWMNRQNSVNILRYSDDGTIWISLVHCSISIIYTPHRQIEVIRPGDNITLISIRRREIRTELFSQNGTFYTEIFDKNGEYITKDFVTQEVTKRYALGTSYSFRDNDTRRVQVTKPDDFELIEPEFRLRYVQGVAIACKIFGRPQCNEKPLKLQIETNGSFSLEEVESRVINGVIQRKTVFNWKQKSNEV